MLLKQGWILSLTIFIAACSSTPKQPAPIVDISPTQSAATAGDYVVKAGDNLFRIALDHGLAYRDIAAWNNIADVNDIKVGQVLKLSGSEGAGSGGVVVSAANTQSSVTTKPISDKAVATNTTAGTSGTATTKTAVSDDDAIKMIWPTQGKVTTAFTQKIKGINIAGTLGQPVVAVADGNVVYSGTGLRGYGRMLIIKHNKVYLTAYGHNNKLLVKEGDTVKKGQKIAEMGNSDAESVKLHFEVRRFGKPVDPEKYLT